METVRDKYGTNERIFANAADSSGNPLTGLTNVKLEIYRKSDGKYFDFNDTTFKTSGWTTRQGVMTELSASLSPGIYYYDFDTTGQSSQFVEESFLMTMTSATAANDPTYGELKVGGYVDQIGISSGVIQYGKGKGMELAQIEDFAKKVWQVVLSNQKTAADTLISKSEFNSLADSVLVDQSDLKMAIESIPQLDDRTDEVLGAISSIKPPVNYSKAIVAVGKKVDGLVSEVKPLVSDFSSVVEKFTGKMNTASENINSSIETVSQLKEGFSGLVDLMKQYGEKMGEQTDMDRRMAQFMSKFQEKDLELVNEKLKNIVVLMTNFKYDILKELNSK